MKYSKYVNTSVEANQISNAVVTIQQDADFAKFPPHTGVLTEVLFKQLNQLCPKSTYTE